MEFRLIFDTVPELFDRCRVRYTPALFADFIAEASIGPKSAVLELGPGTGQATEPILNTDCHYHGIELGNNFIRILKRKYGHREHFTLIHDDFITHDFGAMRFDAIYSAATIQWLPEDIAFRKTFELLKPGGVLGMIMMREDYRESNEALYNRIQDVYRDYFRPAQTYQHRGFGYENAMNYGYTDFKKREYCGERMLTADDYVDYCHTYCEHLTIPEPYRTPFFEGLHRAVQDFGGHIVFRDTYTLLTARKPRK